MEDQQADVRRLVLLRHAKAEHPAGPVPDAQRPLALVGRRQSGRIGATLADGGLVPDLVLCSSSLRTRQTWDLARAALGAEPGEVLHTDVVYQADVEDIVELVQEEGGDARTVLVVGHEPTISATASYLAGAGSEDHAVDLVRSGVPTGTYAVLELSGDWDGLRAASARLVRVVRPD